MALAGAVLVSACGGGGGGGSPATNDTAVTPSVAASVNTVINGSTPVPIAFTSSDGHALTNLTVNISALPVGWSATTSTFTCATVTTGNGCLLNLTFAPTTASSGTLTLGYTYTNNAGTAKSGTITIPYASTTNDNVVATPSPTGPVTVIAPTGSQTFSVTFTTDDGNAASNLTLTTALSSLPAGWSSTVPSLTCASVSTGNGCVLPLTFAPTTSESGTLTVGYSYASNAGVAKTGSFSIDYTGTAHNHVVGTPTPTPPVDVVVSSGSQVVTVNFAIDGGTGATNLQITGGLTGLPAGWTVTANTTPCATVTTGNGCQVQLKYQPTAFASGTVALTYSYVDESGSPGTGSVSIPYAGTTNNNSSTAVSPTGVINTFIGATQAVSVTFTTDDMHPATNLHFTAGLTSLPTGWSTSTPTFSCPTFSTGNGCVLGLTFHPTSATNGTVLLNYAYTSNSGAAKTGSVSIAYVGSTHDHAVGTISPTGQIAVVSGSTNSSITVTFNSDDANSETGFSITSGLSALPAGWTKTGGGTTFSCATVLPTGAGCQLGLTYHPTAATPPTSFALGFGYTDSDNTANTGSVTVNYAGTTNNNVGGTVSPTSTSTAPIVAGTRSTTPVTITFITDDANSATGFSVAATGAQSLATLPSGWTGPSTYTCATVASTGTACQLSLSFDPTTAAAATSFVLSYSYTPSETSVGNKAGTVTIYYSSVAGHIYVADGGTVATTNKVARCAIDPTTGVASGCTSVFAATNLDPRAIVINGNFAYVSTRAANGVYVCPVNADGTLGTCTTTGSGFQGPQGMTASGGRLYVANIGGFVSLCTISSIDGTLSNCTVTSASAFTTAGQNFQSPAAIVISGTTAYIAEELYDASATMPITTNGSIITCTVSAVDGTLGSCVLAAIGVSTAGGTLPHNNPDALTTSGTSLYIGFPGGSGVCTMGAGNTVTGCTSTGPTSDDHGIAIAPGFAYIGDNVTPQLSLCAITAGAISASCTATGSGITSPEGVLIY
jgi:hypothetical protein